LNRVERGANYGWPACRGSAAIGEQFSVEPYWSDRLKIVDGKAQCRLSPDDSARYRPASRTYYADSTVGISDLTVYRGDAFPGWRGNLLIAMLRKKRLVRVEMDGTRPVRDDVLLDGEYGRIRDVAIGPDGFVYVLTNEPGTDGLWSGRSRVLRLRPPPAGSTNR
jgi:glucose/arabinose dehydrogenase